MAMRPFQSKPMGKKGAPMAKKGPPMAKKGPPMAYGRGMKDGGMVKKGKAC